MADQFSARWIFSSTRLHEVVVFPLRDFIYLYYDPLCVTLKISSISFVSNLQGSITVQPQYYWEYFITELWTTVYFVW